MIENIYKLEDWRALKIPHTVKIGDESEPTKTLVIEFNKNRKVLSTREGFKTVKYVGNNSIPVPFWDKVHNYKDYEKQVLKKIVIDKKDIALLSTGANMDNLAVAKEEFDEFYTIAFTTAGAKFNAIRLGDEEADYIEKDFKTYKIVNGKLVEKEKVGTVNIILITNADLTDGAMARAIITITEAKTNAFQELNIKSTKYPELQATGTGTDNIIVVKGFGKKADYTGGHTKLGEMIAKCVKKSVKEALIKQDELTNI
ncbi:adenosylcobinamide amidohydrolase [Methanothermococcus sp.]|uniref:adenosylcobinamide amidohydrolase n=1 Tax=Methanothermococcus sp. TaxID=2614238 RepID=UPI0025E66546|nr:adenosylcobinamide amidohydrolase [Methanothermococcus sp.]